MSKKCICGTEMTFHDWEHRYVCHRCGRTKTCNIYAIKEITRSNVLSAEQYLVDNGVQPDEAQTVLQALGYILLDEELYP